MTAATQSPLFLAILPQLGLLVLAALIFALDLVLKPSSRRLLAPVTALGLVGVGLAAALWGRGGTGFGTMLRSDGLSFAFTIIFLFGGALTALLMQDDPEAGGRGEFYLLLVVAVLGMTLMAGAADLVMVFLAVETTSIPLYILAGFLRRDARSSEAGFKYLLYGALTSAVMLYGLSLLYGFSGTTNLYEIAFRLFAGALPTAAVSLVLVLVLVGIGFKISAVPFHFWAPDVYQGAPSPVSGFLSTASKAAGFALLLRLLYLAFPFDALVWSLLIAGLSAASMTFGNLQAMAQKDIKRLLAYSSIAQAGYILIGVAAVGEVGRAAVVFYLAAYLVTNLAAFAIVTVIGRRLGSDQIAAYAGLSRRSPGLALALLAALLSLGGIPPFAGFVGKVFLFAAALKSGLTWLAILGIINSIFGLYYYLSVLKVVYLDRSEGDEQALELRGWTRAAVLLCAAGILALGIFFGPVYGIAQAAAAGLF